MPVNIVLYDAAHTYGLDNISFSLNPSTALGAPTYVNAPATATIGITATVTEAFANGVSVMEQFIYTSAQGGYYTYEQYTAGTTILVTATGSAPFTTIDRSYAMLFSGNDTLVGNSFNNVMQGGGGNDTIDGGGGTDTALFSGLKSSYVITPSGGAFLVNGPDGQDLLTNIERLQFADFGLAFDTSGHAGEAYRLYQAALNRAPDSGGLGYYIKTLDSGWGEHDIATGFLNSPEFQTLYGTNLTNTAYVTQLYANVLHRAPDSGGLAYQVNALQTGTDRAQLLVNFSESPENQAALIGVMSKGMVYVPG